MLKKNYIQNRYYIIAIKYKVIFSPCIVAQIEDYFTVRNGREHKT